MKSFMKKALSFALVLAMVFSCMNVSTVSAASAKPKTVKTVTLKVNGSKVNKKTINLQIGKKATIKTTVSPSSAKKTISYKTSKPGIATVSSKGVVTTKALGKSKITVSVKGKDKKTKSAYFNVNVTAVAVTGVSAKAAASSIKIGATTTISASVLPANATDKALKYTSNNNSVATVTAQGVVTGVKEGTATITISASNGKKATVIITVNKVEVTGVTAAIDSEEIGVSELATVSATVKPSNATDKTVTYTSEDPSVATVNKAGIVVGIAPGTTNIVSTTANGVVDAVSVTVNAIPVKGISIAPTKVSLTPSGTTQLTVTMNPVNATNQQVIWSSDNENTATVSQEGIVTGVATGNAIITATTADGHKTAICSVSVSDSTGGGSETAKNVVAMTVTNPYEDNEGAVYENTVLVGRDMAVRVRVTNDGQPVGNTNVKMNLSPLYGNCPNLFEVSNQNITTDASGYATFVVGLKDSYSTKDAVSGLFQSFLAKVTDSASNESSEITIKFASIFLNGVSVMNNNSILYNDITPSTNALVTDKGLSVTSSINACQQEEYVHSQQVSSDAEDHKVVFEAAPYLLLPASSESVTVGTWSDSVDKTSGEYSVYNDKTNTTTTGFIQKIPAGLQYVTLHFDKVLLSEYTLMYIDVYSTSGTLLTSKTVTNIYNADNTSIQMDSLYDEDSYMVVSLKSEGQVNDSKNEGYVLKSVTGKWATTADKQYDLKEINQAVTWKDVSSEVAFEIKSWSYEAAAQYLPDDSDFLKEEYSYSYKIPVFPYTGNAIISISDANGNIKAYYSYPTVRKADENVNTLAPLDNKMKAIQITADEVATNNKTDLKTTGNTAFVDTKTTGWCALEANVSVKGLTSKELSIVNSSLLYTSVQWDPIPNSQTVDTVDDFYAVEGQTVVITAQLKDGNGNNATVSGEVINFWDDNQQKATLQTAFGGTDGQHTATVQNGVLSTDTNGQVSFKVSGPALAYIKGLYAKTASDKYNVQLSLKDSNNNETAVSKLNLYWVDLGLSFVNNAIDKNLFDEYEDDPDYKDALNQVTTIEYSGAKTIPGFSSYSVNNDWNIGYKVVAQALAGNTITSIKGVDISYKKSDTGANSSLTSNNNIAVLKSTKSGNTTLTGSLSAASVNNSIMFAIKMADGSVKNYYNVGIGETNALGENGAQLALNVTWYPAGMQADIIVNSKTVDVNTDSVAYIKLQDSQKNALSNVNVTYSITGLHIVDRQMTATNASGIVAIPLDAPGVEGTDTIVVSVGGLEKTLQITYVDNQAAPFSIRTEDETTQLYAVKVTGTNTLTVYFNNNVSADTVKAKEFIFTDTVSANKYTVTSATVSGTDSNAVDIVLGANIANPANVHSISVVEYQEELTGIIYKLADTNGQYLTGTSVLDFVPDNRGVSDEQ